MHLKYHKCKKTNELINDYLTGDIHVSKTRYILSYVIKCHFLNGVQRILELNFLNTFANYGFQFVEVVTPFTLYSCSFCHQLHFSSGKH